jgi:hypothetical protein
MQTVPLAIVHTVGQTVAGLVIGTAADSIFPMPCPLKSDDTMGFLVLTGEVAAQSVLTGLLSASYMSMTNQSGSPFNDPTGGMGFMLSLAESQPNLGEKIKTLAGYVSAQFRKMYGRQPADYPTGNVYVQSMSQKAMANPYNN